MKKLGIILIIFLFISPETPQNDYYELVDIATIIHDQELQLEEWVVTLKEKVTLKQVENHMTTFKKISNVKYTEYKHVSKYVINEDYNDVDINVTYEIIIPKDPHYAPELVVIMKGTSIMPVALSEYKEILKHVRNQFFTNNYMLFTCLTASKNGKIANDDFLKKLSNTLDLMYVSTQTDEKNADFNQEIIYGYTPKWKNEMTIENKPLNIQLVIQRHDDEKQKVIIGTPLLITEY